jgi:hypothetical protein
MALLSFSRPAFSIGCTIGRPGDQRRLQDLVVELGDERAVLDQQADEGGEVAGVEGRGVGGDAAWQVGDADDLHPAGLDDLAGLGADDIAALLHRQVHQHRAGLHRGDVLGADQLGRHPAGDQRGGDDDVLLLDVLGHQRRLLFLIGVAHRLGVAGGGLGGLELLVLDRDELGAQALDLLLGRRAHVGGGDHRAQAPRGGDRLQAGDAGAHHEHLGRGDGAGRGHHHRHRPAIDLGRLDHRAVAGEVGLAGQRVHHLGAGDARHEFHGEHGRAAARPAPRRAPRDPGTD